MATNAEIVSTNNAALSALQDKLQGIKNRVDQLTVKDANGVLDAKTLELDAKNYLKAVELSDFAREVAARKEEYERANGVLIALTMPGKQLVADIVAKRKAWEQEERRKAEEEQRRINEENRIAAQKKADEERKERERIAAQELKAREAELEKQRKAGEIGKREAERLKKEAAEAEAREKARAAADAQKAVDSTPQVIVRPNIPTMQGTVSRVNWKFKIVDETIIPRLYCMPNEVAIGTQVRGIKDKARAEALIPGIEVWSE